ncbi:MAG: deoxyribonuclease [Gammaproteobacteria bacterium]|nr:deoxyribonuclease [Gammaproteobacteria bacterium]
MGEVGGRQRGFLRGEKLRIALVVGIISLLAWNVFFVNWDEPGVAKSYSKTKAVQVESESPPRGSESSGDGAKAIDPGGGEEARVIIAGARQAGEPPSPTELFAKAEEYVQAGKKADAYLLHFFLVKQGHGPSAMLLAEMADPSFHDPNKSFLDGPNFAQAHKWYVQALILGQEEADKRLADLKLRVKAAAAGGDENARRLLVGW